MKLVTFQKQDKTSYGVLVGHEVLDVQAAWPDGPSSLLELLQQGDGALNRLRELVRQGGPMLPSQGLRLLAPLPVPPKVIGLAVNYVEHHNEFDRGAPLPDHPKFHTTPRPFLMPSTCVIGPGDMIPWPVFSKQIDHEIELAVVIGSTCRQVSAQDARRHIVGYTIANDVSARSCTHAAGREKRPKDDFFDWLHGKWADGFCPLGPCITTADEIGDPMSLRLELSVNGEVRQSATTAAMIFDVYELVSFISHIMTLTPGDIIATGTPSGVAMATGKWLRGGDVVTCRIEKIGELTNTVGPEPVRFFAPCEKG